MAMSTTLPRLIKALNSAKKPVVFFAMGFSPLYVF